MNKRTLVTILAILALLLAVWAIRSAAPQQSDTLAAGQATQTSSLTALNAQGNSPTIPTEEPAEGTQESQTAPDEHGAYTSKEDVSCYLFSYGHLPKNFITKSDARALGWNGGGLDDYEYGKCIGGDRFGNNEGLLPEADGREYYECDIDTLHRDDRGAKRIVYSNDGLIYYTGDHYGSFELLYGEP